MCSTFFVHHFQLMHILFRQHYRNFIGYNLFVVDLFYPHPCTLNECIIFGLNHSLLFFFLKRK